MFQLWLPAVVHERSLYLEHKLCSYSSDEHLGLLGLDREFGNEDLKFSNEKPAKYFVFDI